MSKKCVQKGGMGVKISGGDEFKNWEMREKKI